ncbi:unnamed protein product [Rhizophagus irregularis]|uniref:Uncharacterized protein n=1 Tax=Rhizophagus irregularis TaxID=588596 RepID=A0A915ZUU7_9GLOM|nr:unnamed protein product [Rhizophagus irregularis]
MLAIAEQLTDGGADGVAEAGRIGRFDFDHDGGLALDLIPPAPRVLAGPAVAQAGDDWRQRSHLYGTHDLPDELGRVWIVGALRIPPAGLAAPASPSPEIHAPILDWQQDDVFARAPDAERPDLVLAVLVGWRIVAEQLPMAIEPRIARPSHDSPRVAALSRCRPDDVDPVDVLVADLTAEPLDSDLTVLLALDRFEVSVDEPVLARDENTLFPAIALGTWETAATERRVLLGSTRVILHPGYGAEEDRHPKPPNVPRVAMTGHQARQGGNGMWRSLLTDSSGLGPRPSVKPRFGPIDTKPLTR